MTTPRAPLDDRSRVLHEEALDSDPIAHVQRWLDDAISAAVVEPSAMALATVDGLGNLHNRMVLLRGWDARGASFYTSYSSVKGRDLDVCPRGAAVLWWGALERQVRIEGSIVKLSEEESDAYFATRPRGHQLAAWASEQSEPLPERDLLAQRYDHFAERFADESIPRPHSWGGYRLRPDRIELWQGRPNRLHDRIEYRRDNAAWRLERLQP